MPKYPLFPYVERTASRHKFCKECLQTAVFPPELLTVHLSCTKSSYPCNRHRLFSFSSSLSQ